MVGRFRRRIEAASTPRGVAAVFVGGLLAGSLLAAGLGTATTAGGDGSPTAGPVASEASPRPTATSSATPTPAPGTPRRWFTGGTLPVSEWAPGVLAILDTLPWEIASATVQFGGYGDDGEDSWGIVIDAHDLEAWFTGLPMRLFVPGADGGSPAPGDGPAYALGPSRNDGVRTFYGSGVLGTLATFVRPVATGDDVVDRVTLRIAAAALRDDGTVRRLDGYPRIPSIMRDCDEVPAVGSAFLDGFARAAGAAGAAVLARGACQWQEQITEVRIAYLSAATTGDPLAFIAAVAPTFSAAGLEVRAQGLALYSVTPGRICSASQAFWLEIVEDVWNPPGSYGRTRWLITLVASADQFDARGRLRPDSAFPICTTPGDG